MSEPIFEWDPAKARGNLAKHGVSFEEAIEAFDDPLAITGFDRIVEGEERWRTIGRTGFFTVLFVVHTHEDENHQVHVRIISARRADRRERAAYERGDEEAFR